MSSINQERQTKIINFISEYIALCRRYKVIITGAIGADVSLSDYFSKWTDPEEEIRQELYSTVHQMIYGLSFPGLYDDSGNRPVSKKELDHIWDSIKDLLE